MIEFIKKHKKALIIGGCVVGGLGVGMWLWGPAILSVLGACATPVAAAFGAAGEGDPEEPMTGADDPIAETEKTSAEAASNPECNEKRGYTKPTEPFKCCPCIVNLPEGRHPSEEKIRTAKENGFDLKGDQTWREGCTKCNHTESDEERSNENGD